MKVLRYVGGLRRLKIELRRHVKLRFAQPTGDDVIG
jgi:hypothetical protein